MIFDEDFTDYSELGNIYDSAEELAGVLDPLEQYDSDFVAYVAFCLYDEYIIDKIAYADVARFEYRIASRLTQVYPLLYKKYQYFKNLTDEDVTADEFAKTGGMKSDRLTEVAVDGTSFQKTANTPTKITPTDTTDFTSQYTNFQGKIKTDSSSSEDSATNVSRHGGTEELFKLLDKLPKSLYDEVCMLFANHFISIY